MRNKNIYWMYAIESISLARCLLLAFPWGILAVIIDSVGIGLFSIILSGHRGAGKLYNIFYLC